MTETDDKATLATREAAAEWVVRLGGAQVTQSDQKAFSAWLRRSPLHVKEYLRAEAAWMEMDDAAQGDNADVAALLRQPLANVIPAPSIPSTNKTQPNASRAPAEKTLVPFEIRSNYRQEMPIKRWPIAALAATVLLALGVVFAPRVIERLDPDTYVTGVGEQRRVKLTDGSAIELNTHSKVKVRLSKTSRDIYLAEGEAFFDVARDPLRPFRVLSDTTVVRALGTQFNVYRRSQGTFVTVIEGRVAVSKREQPAEQSLLEVAAGSTVQVVSKAIMPRQLAKAANAVAWREHRVVFENEALAAVVAEFNRYNERQLALEGDKLGQLRISGVFDPNAPEDLVAFLERLNDAHAMESKQGILLSPVR